MKTTLTLNSLKFIMAKDTHRISKSVNIIKSIRKSNTCEEKYQYRPEDTWY
jgi:DNA-directed RNA polymerase subunit H (RpoH/RPB5)